MAPVGLPWVGADRRSFGCYGDGVSFAGHGASASSLRPFWGPLSRPEGQGTSEAAGLVRVGAALSHACPHSSE